MTTESASAPDRRRGEAGFALLVVLWTLVLITLLVAAISAAGRSEARITASLRDAEVAREAVDGAVQEAIFRVAAGQWSTGPLVQRIQIGPVMTEVQIVDDAGKVDLNNSPLRLLNALLQQIGLPPPRAATLSAAIQDYHSSSLEPEPGGAKAAEYQAAGLPYGPSRMAFRNLDELRVVLGMTPEIFARVAPYLSAVKSTGIDLTKADPVVQHAVTAAAAGGAMPRVVLDPTGPVTVELYGRAVSGGANAARHATIRLAFPGQPGDRLFTLLTWD